MHKTNQCHHGKDIGVHCEACKKLYAALDATSLLRAENQALRLKLSELQSRHESLELKLAQSDSCRPTTRPRQSKTDSG